MCIFYFKNFPANDNRSASISSSSLDLGSIGSLDSVNLTLTGFLALKGSELKCPE